MAKREVERSDSFYFRFRDSLAMLRDHEEICRVRSSLRLGVGRDHLREYSDV